MLGGNPFTHLSPKLPLGSLRNSISSVGKTVSLMFSFLLRVLSGLSELL